MTTSGQSLNDIEAIEVWRAELPQGQEPPPPLTAQDRALQRQLLEGQGEVLRRLEPSEIAAVTRGSQLVYRDDLDLWRQSFEGDPGSMVLWYGVRTICCRKRESGLSNVARLLPSKPPDPPDGLALEAGAQGIDVRWRAVPGVLVLVERSARRDRVEIGGRATGDKATPGGTLRRPRDAAWSFRLRSVIQLEGGGRVVGEASPAARVDHPDTYPPDMPAEVVCLPEGARVRIRWQAVSGAAGYEVARRHGGEPASVLISDLTSVEFIDPEPPLGSITYIVVARDEVGNASEPAECSVVMGAVP